jgi:hypothetical protein
MAGLDIKKMDTPDEKRPFVDKGHANFVDLDGTAVSKARLSRAGDGLST